MLNVKKAELNLSFPYKIEFLRKYAFYFLFIALCVISIDTFIFFYINGLGLSYNDARSHLDIGRRVVEGLKPGLAQLGSVWLPLPHILMIPTIWNDFFWHSGLSGALISMISYVGTSLLIYLYLQNLGVGFFGRIIGLSIFALNLNILYLQSTAMTELLLIATSTAVSYYLMLWARAGKIIDIIKSAFWVMLSTLTRYDGWFLFLMSAAVAGWIPFFKDKFSQSLRINFKSNLQRVEGMVIFFCTLGGFGIALWFFWNQLIFKDWLYFAFGPYSARVQQQQLELAGNLITKSNWIASFQAFTYSLFYNVGTFAVLLSILGYLLFWIDKNIIGKVKIASTTLLAPLFFNVLALYFGHSVLFIQGINGETWFNVRYGINLIPAVAISVGFLVHRLKDLRLTLAGLLLFVTFFSFTSFDAVTIDDARVGSSQKNVTEVSGWLNRNTKDKEGFILISAASHDAIIFSSGLPMSRFIHEGTGRYWESATTNPERWARWIIMRTYDDNDSTYKSVSRTPDFVNYDLVEKYPFADIYQIRDEYLPGLNTKPVLGRQK